VLTHRRRLISLIKAGERSPAFKKKGGNMLLETKAKFFDLQRVIEKKEMELKNLYQLRVELVQEINKLEEPEQFKEELITA